MNEIAVSTCEQLISAAKEFCKRSIAIDESTCRSYTELFAVFIRSVDKQACIAEELLDLIPMKGTVTARDVLLKLYKCVDCPGLDCSKLASIATDGAPAMCSEKMGLVAKQTSREL